MGSLVPAHSRAVPPAAPAGTKIVPPEPHAWMAERIARVFTVVLSPTAPYEVMEQIFQRTGSANEGESGVGAAGVGSIGVDLPET